MVRLPFVFFVAGLLLPFAVNSSVITKRSFIELAKRASDEEICGQANYFICSDGESCCPNGYLCIDTGCVKDPDNPDNVPTRTNIPVFTLNPDSPRKPVLSTGAIAGIAVGGALFFIAVGAAVFFCLRKRKIGKEVLKAYEDPNRNMYDQVVVEGKRISVVPISGSTTQQRRQTQTQLSPPNEEQEFQIAEGVTAQQPEQQQIQFQQIPLPPPQQQLQLQQHEQYQQYQQHQQHQQHQYQAYQQPQHLETNTIDHDPVPEALRVGSPISPIRADSLGLIPVGPDSPNQHPYQFSPVQGMVRHHSTPLPPAPHHSPSPPPLPQTTSLPTIPRQSPPPQSSQSPVYYQSSSSPPPLPPQAHITQSSGGYNPPPLSPPPPPAPLPQEYGEQQQQQGMGQYPQYQQQQYSHPPPSQSFQQQPTSPVSPMTSPLTNPSRRTGDYFDWELL